MKKILYMIDKLSKEINGLIFQPKVVKVKAKNDPIEELCATVIRYCKPSGYRKLFLFLSVCCLLLVINEIYYLQFYNIADLTMKPNIVLILFIILIIIAYKFASNIYVQKIKIRISIDIWIRLIKKKFSMR